MHKGKPLQQSPHGALRLNHGYVYILSNKPNGVLFSGVTSDLVRRVTEHKKKSNAGYTSQYDLDKLLYFESYDSIDQAIEREQAMKLWTRSRKIEHIEMNNPDWRDLYAELLPSAPAAA
jgi:putative endonuclease